LPGLTSTSDRPGATTTLLRSKPRLGAAPTLVNLPDTYRKRDMNSGFRAMRRKLASMRQRTLCPDRAIAIICANERAKIVGSEYRTTACYATREDLFRSLGVDSIFRPAVSQTYSRSGEPHLRCVGDFIAKPNVVTSLARKMLPEAATTPVKIALRGFKPAGRRKSSRTRAPCCGITHTMSLSG
jgi:hypothetical protein